MGRFLIIIIYLEWKHKSFLKPAYIVKSTLTGENL